MSSRNTSGSRHLLSSRNPPEVTSNLGLMAAALRGGAEMLAPLCTFTASQISVTSSCSNRL